MCSCVCEVEDLKNMQPLIYRRAVDIAGECPVTSLCDMFNYQQSALLGELGFLKGKWRERKQRNDNGDRA